MKTYFLKFFSLFWLIFWPNSVNIFYSNRKFDRLRSKLQFFNRYFYENQSKFWNCDRNYDRNWSKYHPSKLRRILTDFSVKISSVKTKKDFFEIWPVGFWPIFRSKYKILTEYGGRKIGHNFIWPILAVENSVKIFFDLLFGQKIFWPTINRSK